MISETAHPGRGTGFLYLTSPSPQGYQRQHDGDDFQFHLETILNDPERAQKAGNRAMTWADKSLTADREAYEILRVYREVSRNPGMIRA